METYKFVGGTQHGKETTIKTSLVRVVDGKHIVEIDTAEKLLSPIHDNEEEYCLTAWFKPSSLHIPHYFVLSELSDDDTALALAIKSLNEEFK